MPVLNISKLFTLILITALLGCKQPEDSIEWLKTLEHHSKQEYTPALNELSKLDDDILTCFMMEIKADCYHNLGNFEQAISYFERVKTNCELTSQSYNNLGDSYYKIGKPGKALENFKLAYKINAENESTNFNMGLCYYELNLPNKAKQHLKKAIELNGKDLESYDLLIQIHNVNAEFDSAFMALKRVQNHSNKARIKLMEAYIYTYKGDNLTSLKLINEVLDMEVKDEQTRANALVNRYIIYYENGDKEKACIEYHNLINSYPNIRIEKYYNCDE